VCRERLQGALVQGALVLFKASSFSACTSRPPLQLHHVRAVSKAHRGSVREVKDIRAYR